MATKFKENEHVYFAFENGETVFDRQFKPRMYKTIEQFKKNTPENMYKMVEYGPVKYGKWKSRYKNGSLLFGNRIRCSCCDGINDNYSEFCPHCGANMEVE